MTILKLTVFLINKDDISFKDQLIIELAKPVIDNKKFIKSRVTEERDISVLLI